MRDYRARNPEYLRQERERERARTAARVGPAPKRAKHSVDDPRKATVQGQARYAVRIGKLQKEPCLFCDAPKVEAHHHDYARPFDVTWLCRKHHRMIHRVVG